MLGSRPVRPRQQPDGRDRGLLQPEQGGWGPLVMGSRDAMDKMLEGASLGLHPGSAAGPLCDLRRAA